MKYLTSFSSNNNPVIILLHLINVRRFLFSFVTSVILFVI